MAPDGNEPAAMSLLHLSGCNEPAAVNLLQCTYRNESAGKAVCVFAAAHRVVLFHKTNVVLCTCSFVRGIDSTGSPN